MKKSIARTIAASVMLVGCLHAYANSEVTKDDNKNTVWQAGVDGVEIEWGPDGAFKRIYSSYNQSVLFPDRQGILKAQTIAEEKAKAAIVRFMNGEQVSSSRVITEVSADMETASRSQGSGKEDTLSKENIRKMTSELKEVTSSYASGRLRGVILLEKGYDEKRGEAWTKVGISRKTMDAAQSLSSAINDPDSTSSSGNTEKGSGTLRQPSEVRRTNQADW
jgi:hypothetical protein